MNGFSNVAPQLVTDIDGSNPRMKTFDPEQANQYEFGVKTDLFEKRLALTASYYDITVNNRLMQDPDNINNSIQGGKVGSKGIEVSVIANPIDGLNIIAGYSFSESEVLEDNPANGYLGFRPEEAGPQQLINYWVSYTIPTTKLRGLGIGFGGNAASEHKTMNRESTGTFSLPAYHIMNASLFYQTRSMSITLKINNLENTKYYSGWSTVTPQQLRSVSLGLNYRF
jgi:iron complex outermembrane receptor protein